MIYSVFKSEFKELKKANNPLSSAVLWLAGKYSTGILHTMLLVDSFLFFFFFTLPKVKIRLSGTCFCCFSKQSQLADSFVFIL